MQGSEEWLAWRSGGIGSSDAAVIMGLSPYKTPYQLWEERTGRAQEEDIGFAGFIGHRAEPYIRRLIEQGTGQIFEPVTIVSKDFPFMLASLDGSTLTMDLILECKLNAADRHDLVRNGEIPEDHLAQVQHQLLVTGARQCIYVSAPYTDHPDKLTQSDLIVLHIKPEPGIFGQLISKEGEFVEFIATDTPPPTEDQPEEVRSKKWTRAVARWKRAKRQSDEASEALSRAKDELIAIAGDRSVYGAGVRLTRSWKRGRISYSAIPELNGVPLDQYRGKGYFETRVTEMKEKKDA